MTNAPSRPPAGDAAASRTAHPPETLEGWYASHRVLRIDRAATGPQGITTSAIATRLYDAVTESAAQAGTVGWSALAELTGCAGDFLVIHFRPTMEAVRAAERVVADDGVSSWLHDSYTFLSVTEAGLYHATAQLARDTVARGGAVGDETYRAELTKRKQAELASSHVQRRLYPTVSGDMPYVCFYPMSKRRTPGQNWYALSLDERSRLMQEHGLTGRRYAGRVHQVITGSIGFNAWEWGVTLFARDPLDFKTLVTDMRFDEVSAEYAEFGDFYAGRLVTGAGIAR